MLKIKALQSTAITRVAYDDETRQLEITFVSGRRYTHESVPQNVFDELVYDPSPGSYYNQNIKGVY